MQIADLAPPGLRLSVRTVTAVHPGGTRHHVWPCFELETSIPFPPGISGPVRSYDHDGHPIVGVASASWTAEPSDVGGGNSSWSVVAAIWPLLALFAPPDAGFGKNDDGSDKLIGQLGNEGAFALQGEGLAAVEIGFDGPRNLSIRYVAGD